MRRKGRLILHGIGKRVQPLHYSRCSNSRVKAMEGKHGTADRASQLQTRMRAISKCPARAVSVSRVLARLGCRLILSRSGVAKVCDIYNHALPQLVGTAVKSGCESGGSAFLCDSYAPVPVADDLSYGFAVMNGKEKCCQCFELAWTSGDAEGKRMVVQVVDTTGDNPDPNSSVQKSDVILMTPGGGVGQFDSGCRTQYGTSW